VLIYDFNNSSGVESEVRTFPDLDLVARLQSTNQAALSNDGSRALVVDLRTLDLRPQLWDVDQNIRISYLDAVDGFLGYEALSFSPDGSQVAVLSEHGIFLFNGHSGRLDAALGRTDINHTSTFTRDSASLFTVSDADTILWDTGDALASAGTPLATAATPSVWINQDDVKEGPRLAIMTLIEDEATSAALQWGAAINLLDPDTGEVTQTFLGVGEQLPDGRFFLNRVESTDTPTGFDRIEGPLVIWDPDEGTVTEVTDCVELATAINRYEAECPVYRDLWASQDGAVLAAGSWVPITDPTLIRIWDASTLELLSEFETAESDLHLMHAGTDWLALFRGSQAQLLIVDFNGELIATLNAVNSILYRLAESPDGSTIFLRDLGGEVSAYDTSSWEHLSTWKAHESLTRGIAIHPDGHTLATTGSDGFVNVWEISALQELGEGLPPPLLDRIPTPVASDAAWLDDQTLMLFLRDGAKQMVISLGQEDVVADAVARLTRGFTLEECAVYQIGDCPTTLDAIREG
jgi:WD40 repeat protein